MKGSAIGCYAGHRRILAIAKMEGAYTMLDLIVQGDLVLSEETVQDGIAGILQGSAIDHQFYRTEAN